MYANWDIVYSIDDTECSLGYADPKENGRGVGPKGENLDFF